MMQIKGKVVPEYSIKAYGVGVYFCSYFNLAFDADEWSALHPGHFNPGESTPSTP
jgi:hypothetical protein